MIDYIILNYFTLNFFLKFKQNQYYRKEGSSYIILIFFLSVKDLSHVFILAGLPILF